jgi:hypothetical protein
MTVQIRYSGSFDGRRLIQPDSGLSCAHGAKTVEMDRRKFMREVDPDLQVIDNQ